METENERDENDGNNDDGNRTATFGGLSFLNSTPRPKASSAVKRYGKSGRRSSTPLHALFAKGGKDDDDTYGDRTADVGALDFLLNESTVKGPKASANPRNPVTPPSSSSSSSFKNEAPSSSKMSTRASSRSQ